MKVSGIYQIQSKIKPERIYIGSSVNIRKRFNDHFTELTKGIHKNSRLQKHCNKYGISDLQFSTLLGCDKSDLIKVEQYFIDSKKPYFNISPTAGNTLGCKCSESTKEKIRQKAKGRKVSEETKLKMSYKRKGRKHTEATKEKMRLKALGNKNALGTICSPETREKIRQTKLGNTWGFQKGHKKNGGNKKIA